MYCVASHVPGRCAAKPKLRITACRRLAAWSQPGGWADCSTVWSVPVPPGHPQSGYIQVSLPLPASVLLGWVANNGASNYGVLMRCVDYSVACAAMLLRHKNARYALTMHGRLASLAASVCHPACMLCTFATSLPCASRLPANMLLTQLRLPAGPLLLRSSPRTPTNTGPNPATSTSV
jgi:hypothetical protein